MTVAENNIPGFSGDNGPATQAQLGWPSGFASDAAGNLYIADNSNNRVRKLSPDDIITTAERTGTLGFSGDGGKATEAQLHGP